MSVLVNSVLRPEVDYSTIQITQSATDPMTTANFTLIDTGAAISIAEFQEAIILDDGAFANQTINLMRNPLMNPYNTTWATTAHTGCAFAQASPNGLQVTLTNAAVATQPCLFQNTQAMLTTVGQTYTASVSVTGASIVAAQASITISFLDGLQNVLTTQTSASVVPTGSAQRISTSLVAPASAQFVQVYLNVVPTNATNSGVITFTGAQLEPQLFSALGTMYPTPLCATGQANCTVLPNGTTCRQQRLFTGFVTHLLYDTFTGPNRNIHVDCSGPVLLMDATFNFESISNQTDQAIILDQMSDEFTPAGPFSTNHVQVGITFDMFTLANDTVRRAMDNICAITGFRWYVDPYYDIWYLPVGFYSHAFGISDTPDNVTTFTFATYSREVDFTQPCNSAYVQVSSGGNNVIVQDSASVGKYNRAFLRSIVEQSVTTNAMGYQRGLAEVMQFGYGRTIIHLEIDQRAAQPITVGNTLTITNSVDSGGPTLPTAYLVQQVTITCLGVDRNLQTRWKYAVDLGSYQPNLTNILRKAADDATQSANTLAVSIVQRNLVVTEIMGSTEALTHTP